MFKLLIVAAAAACLLVASAAGHAAPSWSSCTRLPLTVRPTKYDVHLKLVSPEQETYKGQVDISIDFPLANLKRRSLQDLSSKPEFAELIRGLSSDSAPCAESDYIVLHAHEDLEIVELRVLSNSYLGFLNGNQPRERKVAQVQHENGWLAIKLAQGGLSSKLSATVIQIEFEGKIRPNQRGIYVSSYNDGLNTYKHIVAQFQPTDARTAFPCFDEPRFKVPITLRLSHSSKMIAYGTTEVAETNKIPGMTTTRFETTPDMPLHMLSFVIGQFDKPLEVQSASKSGVRVRVITAPGKRETGHFALQVAKDSLEYFEKYIDFEFPLKKLDVIAIADLAKVNTEGWGLVFVRDNLIWIDDETKADSKITTALNVAHVVVHQWFGNLLSAAWWSDWWITESVASQFAFRIVQELYQFESEYITRLTTMTTVMQKDQPGKLHALSPPSDELQTSEQIYNQLDNVTFMKSGALAEMVLGYLGANVYQASLRRLAASRAYKTVTLEDYIAAIVNGGVREHFANTINLIEGFSKFKGVPLANVVVDDYSVNVHFEPFSSAKESIEGLNLKSPQSIQMVLDVLWGDGTTGQGKLEKLNLEAREGRHYSQCLRRPRWFDEEASTTAYFKLTPMPTFASYLRARYSNDLLERLKLAVKNKWLSPMDRLQLLDDSNQLVLAKLMPANTFGGLVEAYAREDNNAVLIEMLAVSRTLVDLEQTDVLAKIQPAFDRLVETYGFKTTGDESLLMQRARELVLKSFVLQGNQQVIEAAIKVYEETKGQVALFLREPVYTAIVISNSSLVKDLLDKLSKTQSFEEQIRLLSALSLSRNKSVALRTINWISASGLNKAIVWPFKEAIWTALEEINSSANVKQQQEMRS